MLLVLLVLLGMALLDIVVEALKILNSDMNILSDKELSEWSKFFYERGGRQGGYEELPKEVLSSNFIDFVHTGLNCFPTRLNAEFWISFPGQTNLCTRIKDTLVNNIVMFFKDDIISVEQWKEYMGGDDKYDSPEMIFDREDEVGPYGGAFRDQNDYLAYRGIKPDSF